MDMAKDSVWRGYVAQDTGDESRIRGGSSHLADPNTNTCWTSWTGQKRAIYNKGIQHPYHQMVRMQMGWPLPRKREQNLPAPPRMDIDWGRGSRSYVLSRPICLQCAPTAESHWLV